MRRLLIIPLAAVIGATPVSAQQLPPVRPIGETVARSTEPMGSVSAVVGLPGGKVLVNDILKRRVLLFDSTLTALGVVADSTSSTANAYGGRTGGLLNFRGDSALFVDPASMSMLVINPSGRITRVMSAPRPQDVNALIGGPNGIPGFDAKGKLVYRGPTQGRGGRGGRGGGRGGAGGGGGPPTIEFPDSAPIVRFDLAARTLDTAAFFGIQKPNVKVTQTATGGFSISTAINPLPIVDDWALLSDGTVAIVRGKDYSVDFVASDGSRTSSGRIPYEWQRLDDDAKAAVLDSARAELEKARERAMQGGFDTGALGAMVAGRGGFGGGGDVQVFRGGGGGGPPQRGGGRDGGGRGGEGGRGGGGRGLAMINLVNVDELPDYRPAFTAGASRGDLEGNLWVRTTSPVGNEGPVYFIISREGKVIDRVQLPAGRLVVGFGPGGDVYLALRDAEGNARVERARIK